MRKIFTKILCFTAATFTALGIFAVSACSNTYGGNKLAGDFSGNVSSNGGFVVTKGEYVYFVNGKETNTADNTYGKVEKGALMRISKADFSTHNYKNTETVVPQIIYSGNNNAGIFIYGDYVYYATPSTEKNSDGEVQNSHLAFKRTKLDGTESMKDYFVQYSDNTIDYRYVEVDGTVYLLYVAKSENLYGTSYTNIHSVNTATGENTLLAYNVDSVFFDESDLTNPRIYYTMKVTDFVLGSTSSNYNQIWTVTADATTPNKYDFSEIEDYDAEEDPLYVNCGKLVFDGIGKIEGMTESVTQFNAPELRGENAVKIERSAYTYTISKYTNETLFYTRTSSQNSTAMLFAAKEDDTVNKSDWQPAKGNPENSQCLLRDGSEAANFNYMFEDGELAGALITNSDGLIKAGIGEDGKIIATPDNANTYYMTKKGQPTLLFTQKHNDLNYVYYSLSGGNGYTIYRLSYSGEYDDYEKLSTETTVNEFTPVRVLDLDASSDWYKPEFIQNHIVFVSETANMTEYDAVMVCDMSNVQSNAELKKLNDRYDGIKEKINEVDSEVYENLPNALWYAHFTNDGEYLPKLIKAYQDEMDYDEEHFWSKDSVKFYNEFLKNEGDWKDFADTIKVNGKDVSANKRDFYYCLLGSLTEADAEKYETGLKTTYLQPEPEVEKGWFESLSTGAKVGFLIGVIGGGLLVIAAVVIVTLVIVKKRSKQLPVYKKRIKVDTTDDKNINVYEDEENKD